MSPCHRHLILYAYQFIIIIIIIIIMLSLCITPSLFHSRLKTSTNPSYCSLPHLFRHISQIFKDHFWT